jgi:hypothetical protein
VISRVRAIAERLGVLGKVCVAWSIIAAAWNLLNWWSSFEDAVDKLQRIHAALPFIIQAAFHPLTFLVGLVGAVLIFLHKTAIPEQTSPLIITTGKGSSFEEDAFDPDLRSTRRECITNTSGQTIDDVEVHLEGFTPQGAPFLPIRLQEIHQSQQPFRLHPRQSVYVNVSSYYARPVTRSHQLVLHYDDRSRPNLIPIAKCPYTLTTKVSGRNIDPFPLSPAVASP